jgi:dethiobiotin synthetase
MQGLIIAGTDTGIGKTVLSALLMSALPKVRYWKPIQAGTSEETDSETVSRLLNEGPNRILPEAYRLTNPLSPHLAAALDNIEIQAGRLNLPATDDLLIVELAGGVLVPLRNDLLQIEMVRNWQLPVLLAARSTLGTINHTLLTLEALRNRQIKIMGVVCIGALNPANEEAIEQFGQIEILGRIPALPQVDRASLQQTFNNEFARLRKLLNSDD